MSQRIISGGRVFDTCARCGKLVQLNKPLVGGLHLCATDCQLAGRHLDVQREVRGWWLWERAYLVCRACTYEEPE